MCESNYNNEMRVVEILIERVMCNRVSHSRVLILHGSDNTLDRSRTAQPLRQNDERRTYTVIRKHLAARGRRASHERLTAHHSAVQRLRVALRDAAPARQRRAGEQRVRERVRNDRDEHRILVHAAGQQRERPRVPQERVE